VASDHDTAFNRIGKRTTGEIVSVLEYGKALQELSIS
jgi:hypothetical protein